MDILLNNITVTGEESLTIEMSKDSEIDISRAVDEYTEFNICTDDEIQIEMSDDHQIEFDISVNGSSEPVLPYYSGPYEVTPKTTEQVLQTKDKSMSDNVKIFSIPYAVTSNVFGGLTATIGLE